MDKDTAQRIAATIAEQMGGIGKLRAMVGAKYFSFDPKDGSLSFRFSLCRGMNHVKIVLNSMDLYDMIFTKIRKFDFEEVERHEGLYFDMLIPVFEKVTGLNLILFLKGEDQNGK